MSRVLVLELRQPAEWRRPPGADGRRGGNRYTDGTGVRVGTNTDGDDGNRITDGVDVRAGTSTDGNGGNRITDGIDVRAGTRTDGNGDILAVGSGGGGGGSRREIGRRRWGPSRPLSGFLSVSPPTRVRPRPSGIMHTPEMLIFALGLAALLSLIVFICDMISERSLRPMSLLVFISAGTYCVVLIKRQRALASAEQQLMMEVVQASAAESSRRVISKEDRRTLFDYFTFHPVDGDRAGAEGGRASGKALETRGGDASVPSRGSLVPLAVVRGGSSEGTKVGIPGESSPPACGEPRPDTMVPIGCDSDDAREATGMEPPVLALGVGAAGETSCLSPEDGASSAAACSISTDCFPSLPAVREPSALDVTTSTLDSAGPAGRRRNKCDDEVSGLSGGYSGCSTSGKKGRDEVEENGVPLKGISRGDSCRGWSTGGSCIVCFAEYADGDDLCRLPCRHIYHAQCIDEWLDGANHAWCPLCKVDLAGSQASPGSLASADDSLARTSETVGDAHVGENAV